MTRQLRNISSLVYHQKKVRKIRLESKWNITFWVVPAEHFGEHATGITARNGMFETEIRVPFFQSHL